MTIIATLDLTIVPEKIAEAPSGIAEILVATRAFPGCLGVEVAIDVDDAGHILLIEHWDSLEADAAYRAWRATPDGASNLRSYLAVPPVVSKYSVD
jgi:quinol monooxygenase YgiN